MIVKAHAKINLGLAVLGKRPDGYHDISTVMQSLELADEVRMERREEPGLRFTCSEESLPADRGNLAYRAAELLLGERLLSEGLHLHLEKHIPLAAGLAGGSADAAAVLWGVRRLFDLPVSREELLTLARQLGADVPFCLTGGTLLCEGIGERLSPAPALPPCSILLAKPPVEVSTKEAYGSLLPPGQREEISMDPVLAALREGSLEGLSGAMKNAFEPGVLSLHPEVGELLSALTEAGAVCARMSGSGPTVFGLFSEREQAREAMERLRVSAPRVFTALTEAAGRGVGEAKEI